MSEPTSTPNPKSAGRRPKQSRRTTSQASKTNPGELFEGGTDTRPSTTGHISDSAAMESRRKQPNAPATPPASSNKRNARGNQHAVHSGTQHEYSSDSGVVPQHRQYSPSRSASHGFDTTSVMAAYGGPGASHLVNDTNGNPYLRSPPNVRTPAKQIYAGPNFLASPAPSSLPMPRAFSKSVPSVASRDQIALSEEDQDAEEEEEQAITPLPAKPISTVHNQSPLDVFFNADRAERLRQASQSESPLSASRPKAGFPDNGGRSHSVPHPFPSQTAAQNPVDGSPGSGLFTMEMDGAAARSDRRQYPPNLSYQQRMDSLRRPASHRPDSRPVTQDDDLQRQAKTRALKQMIMSPKDDPAQPGRSATSTQRSQPVQQEVSIDATSSKSTDIQKMEDHLRKVLRLAP